jgi:hypothetical protein
MLHEDRRQGSCTVSLQQLQMLNTVVVLNAAGHVGRFAASCACKRCRTTVSAVEEDPTRLLQPDPRAQMSFLAAAAAAASAESFICHRRTRVHTPGVSRDP